MVVEVDSAVFDIDFSTIMNRGSIQKVLVVLITGYLNLSEEFLFRTQRLLAHFAEHFDNAY